MHEHSLIRALLRQVEALASDHPGDHVVSVRVRIGEFSGVEPDLLVSAYDELVGETPLAGAKLDMERVPLEAACEQCGHHFRVEKFNFECNQCGSLRLTLHGGEELLLDTVTFEETKP